MPTLPTRESLGRPAVAAPNRGRALASIRTRAPDTSAIGRGVQNLGRGVAALGESAEQISNARIAQEMRDETYETERRFQEFKSQSERGLETSMRNVQPGEGKGFANRWHDDFVENQATQFFKTVPPRLQQKYEFKIHGAGRTMFGSARHFEVKEQARSATVQLTTAKNDFQRQARNSQTDELDSVTSEFKILVNSNPHLTPIEKDVLLRRGMRDIGKSHIPTMTPAEIERTFGQKNESIIDRIIGVESAGRADARNPNSTATGLGQFIESTWLDLIERNRPDIAIGKSRKEILELRTDPELSREMVGALMSENKMFLESAGVPPTAGNLYLAHFLGASGAVEVLNAAPDTPASNILSKAVISANKSILSGKSVADVVQWAEGKMAGAVPEAFTFLTDEDRAKVIAAAKRQIETERKRLQKLNEERLNIIAPSKEPKAVDSLTTTIRLKPQLVQDSINLNTAITSPEAIGEEDESVLANRTLAEEAGDRILQEQEAIGVPRSHRKLLTTQQAKQHVQRLVNAGPDQAVGLYLQLQNNGGRHWPRIYSELVQQGLPAGHALIGIVDDDPADMAVVSRSANTPINELRAQDGTDLRKEQNRLLADVSSDIGDFLRVYSRGAQNVTMAASIEEAIRKVALERFQQTGNATDARTFAKDLIESRYETLATSSTEVIIPRASGLTSSHVSRAIDLAQTKARLTEFGPVVESAGAADFLSKERAVSNAVNSGVWLSDEDFTGVVLYHRFRNGAINPVKNKDGERFEIRFEDIPDMLAPLRGDVQQANVLGF